MRPDPNFRLVRYFLNNTYLTVLLFVLVVLAGVFSLARIHVEGFPEVKVPMAIINTFVPGAGPETIVSQITEPIESGLKQVSQIKEINSVSKSGLSSITVTFDSGENINEVTEEIRNRLANVNLPAGVDTPDVFVPVTSGAQYIVAVVGDTDFESLIKQGDVLSEEIEQIDGIESVERAPGIRQAVFIEIDPRFLSQDLINQIQAGSSSSPIGQVFINNKLTPVAGQGQINSIDDLKNYLVSVRFSPTAPPTVVRLGDIADINEGVDFGEEVYRVGYRKDGELQIKRAIYYSVNVVSGSDILHVDRDFQNRISELRADLPAGQDYAVVYDQAKSSREQIDEIFHGAIGQKWGTNPIGYLGYVFGAIWLLMVIIFIFLDWRAALISIVTIPLSFLFTFTVLALLGITLNTIVLFSLVLVLGLIVDPAIVVLESIKRFMELGHRGRESVLYSVGVIGRGIFIAVLTSFIVFVPFIVVSGTFGKIISYIPLTVIPAIVASYFIPMIFLTWLAEKFLRVRYDRGNVVDEDDPHNLWRPGQVMVRINQGVLKKTWLQILIVFLAIAIPIAVTVFYIKSDRIKQVQFATPEDSQFLLVTIPEKGDLLEQSKGFEFVVQNYKDSLTDFFYDSAFSGGQSDGLTVLIELLPYKERKENSTVIAQRLQDDLAREFGEGVLVRELSVGPPSETYQVSVKIFGSDRGVLETASKAVADHLRSDKRVSLVSFDGEKKVEELQLNMKNEVIASLGISAPQIYSQLRALVGEINVMAIDGREAVIKLPVESRLDTKEKLESAVISTPRGPYRLSFLADVRTDEAPESIRRLNGARFVEVQARVAEDRDAVEVQREITQWAEDNATTWGLEKDAFDKRGAQNEFEQSFQELYVAIYLAIFVTFIIFVLFFHSFIQPFIILFAVPLMLIGVFPALDIFTNGQFGFLEIIGLIMLIGIVENVGIFLLDFANKKVDQGMSRKEAAALATGVRLRPILLTQATTLVGLLPLAIFSPFWRGMSVVIIAGIISSGILSLFLTPILYTWLTFRKKETNI